MTPEEAKRIADEATERCRVSNQQSTTLQESLAIADQAVVKVSFATKLQWGAIGVVGVALAGFIVWALSVVGTVGTAQAQAKAASERAATLELRIESVDSSSRVAIEKVDSGTRVAVENLRKEVADERSTTNQKLTDMQVTLQAVLREVRRK